ncbi:HAD family hydrolase [Tichowtungia aerotolerans]|uniref:phosphoglycolate phosphatase n=1 Tax=Tichowtungia aerotolerans TaxID=2697043 RepID=A0A6P1M7R2_9BACT|nr:HAD-IA family hydrolase [Tichowtungia aerotolerans]QHI69907.1 HAD-IA family hydrolase [Tichowtungia aerotolerans]
MIFDLDGTLAETRQDLASGINLMRAHYGLAPLDVETVTGYIGDGIRKLVERSLQGLDVDIDEAVALDKKFYAEHMFDETRLYPGAEEGLKALSAHALAVLSNKPGDPTRAILKHLGVDGLFFRMLGGGDLPNLKPSPDGIEALLAESGISKENTWMIGDHHTDLEVAHNAGVKSGFVTYGLGHAGEFSADQTWSTFGELVDFFS